MLVCAKHLLRCTDRPAPAVFLSADETTIPGYKSQKPTQVHSTAARGYGSPFLVSSLWSGDSTPVFQEEQNVNNNHKQEPAKSSLSIQEATLEVGRGEPARLFFTKPAVAVTSHPIVDAVAQKTG